MTSDWEPVALLFGSRANTLREGPTVHVQGKGKKIIIVNDDRGQIRMQQAQRPFARRHLYSPPPAHIDFLTTDKTYPTLIQGLP